MRASSANAVLSAAFVLWITVTSFAAAQESSKPLLASAPLLCIGGGFVAMVPLGRPQPLIVIKIGGRGIEAPQTLPTTGNEVFGMQCAGSYIELLVEETGSDHFSVLPYTVQQRTIQQQQREDINYSISRRAARPPEVERRMEEFHRTGSRAGDGMLGDWYVQVPRAGVPGHMYEVHFVETETQGLTKLAVTLLDETYDRKTLKSVPLIQEEVSGD